MTVRLAGIVVKLLVTLLACTALAAADDTRLADAVMKRDATAVRALLKARVNVNVPQADGATALKQINEALAALKLDVRRVSASREHYAKLHAARAQELARREEPRGAELTAEYLTACVRRAIGADAIVISEGVTHFQTISNHAGRSRPGTLFNSGGGSLGWCGGAAVGVKLARPEATVVGLVGDGCYMFSVPSSVYWMARRYRTPFLQVIYNNRGWRAPRFSTMTVHPQGHASRGVDIGTSFDPPPDYAGIAAAATIRAASRVLRIGFTLASIIPAVRSPGCRSWAGPNRACVRRAGARRGTVRRGSRRAGGSSSG